MDGSAERGEVGSFPMWRFSGRFWVMDPETRQAWSYDRDGSPKEVPANGELTAGEISIPMV